MNPAIARENNTNEAVLFMALDIGKNNWMAAFGNGKKVRKKSLPARDLERAVEEIDNSKRKLGLPDSARVVCCYEAGRDGFWIHRWMSAIGVECLLVDPGSIERNTKGKSAKTDRLDAEKLLRKLVDYHYGDRKVWSVVNVPSDEVEDERLIHRELQRLKGEKTRLVVRIRSLLFQQGICFDDRIGTKFCEEVKAFRRWDKTPLPSNVSGEIERIYDRLDLLNKQITQITKERQQRIEKPKTKRDRIAAMLITLMGVGETSAWLLATEFFGWRSFKNGKQVGSLAGLTGTPHSSGASNKELGISKAGNVRVRWLAIELAWSWLRWQPQSALSKWFAERFGGTGKRMKRVGIVASARKLLVLLWRFVEFGEVPEGARVKVVA